MNSKKTLLFVFFIIVLLHIVFFIGALNYKGIYTTDSPEYKYCAENIYNYNTSYSASLDENIKPEHFSLRPPGYPVFILFSKLIIDSDYTVLFIQNILSILLLFLLYYKLNFYFNDKKKYLFIVGLIAFPIYLIMVNMIMADILLGILLTISWLFLDKFIKQQKYYYLLLFNVFLGFSAITKPVMMYFWIVNIAYAIYLAIKYKKLYPLFMSLILVFVITLWTYRNYQKTNYFHFSSIKAKNLIDVNAGDVLIYKYGEDYKKQFIKHAKEKAYKLPTYKEQSESLLNSAKEILLGNPILYSILHAKGMLNFMIAPGRIDVETFLSLNTDKPISLYREIEKRGFVNGLISYINNVNIAFILLVVIIVIWNIFSLALLLFSFFSKKIDVSIRIFLFLLLLYIIFASGSGGYARFKTSIYFFMLYLLPFGFDVVRVCWEKPNRLL